MSSASVSGLGSFRLDRCAPRPPWPPPRGPRLTSRHELPRRRRRQWVGLRPQFLRNYQRLDAQTRPPLRFFDGAMHLAMMHPAERHRELIADLATERPGLREAQMMGIGGLAAAYEAGLCGDKFAVMLVAQPARFGRDGVVLQNLGAVALGAGVLCRRLCEVASEGKVGCDEGLAPRSAQFE